MKCNKCSNEGVEVTALNKTSWYCRVCKDDINNLTEAIFGSDCISEMQKIYNKICSDIIKQQEVLSKPKIEVVENTGLLYNGLSWYELLEQEQEGEDFKESITDYIEIDKEDLSNAFRKHWSGPEFNSHVQKWADSIWKILQEN